jgi:hypothetical protein
MLKINSATTKKQLLNSLASFANQKDDLSIEVESLPNFLTTPVAFTIFSYQLSNYPRKILWTSQNPTIFGFLRTCKILTFTQKPESYLSQNKSRTDVIYSNNSNPKRKPILASMDSLSSKKPPKISIVSEKKLTLTPQIIKKENFEVQKPQIQKPSSQPFPTFRGYNSQQIQPKRPFVRAKDLLKESFYKNNLLFDNEGLIENSKNDEENITQRQDSFVTSLQKLFKRDIQKKSEPKTTFFNKNSSELNSQKSHKNSKIPNLFFETKEKKQPLEADKIKKISSTSNNTEFLSLKNLLKDIKPVDSNLRPVIDLQKPKPQENSLRNFLNNNLDSQNNFEENLSAYDKTKTEEKSKFKEKEFIKIKSNQKETDQKAGFQDLDSWIKKIENTRKALNNKTSVNNYFSQSFQTQQNFSVNKNFSFVNWFFASFLLTSLVLMFLTSFPTQVYTLNINPTEETAKADLNFDKKDFSSNTVPLEISATTPATEAKEISILKAIGKVEITNNTNSNIFFDSEGIILIANNGLKYKHIKQEEDPGTFRINPKSSVLITIEAVDSGDEYELSENTVIRKITNLKSASLGSNLFAVVKQKISNKTFSETEKIVAQNDIDKLSTKVKEQINTTKEEQIQKIGQRAGSLGNVNWVKNTSLGITFDKQVGQQAEKITGEGKTSIQIFYLEKKIIENRLKNINSEIAQVNSYKILESSGNFEDKNPITIRIEYTYLNYSEINKQKVSESIVNNNHNLDSLKNDLKQEYPYIQNIERTESGFTIPGVPARIEISVQVRK